MFEILRKKLNSKKKPIQEIKRTLNTEEAHEYHVIQQAQIDWTNYFTDNMITEKEQDPILHYIRQWKSKPNLKLKGFFDTAFYLSNYTDIKEMELNPLLHYLEHGKNEGRKGFEDIHKNQQIVTDQTSNKQIKKLFGLSKAQRSEYKSLSMIEIDWSNYFEYNGFESAGEEALIHYIKNWNECTPVIPGYFDTALYLQLYKDIKDNGVNPLLHYKINGREEGRIGHFEIKNYVLKGGISHDSSKSTIVFVSHQSSATGAPLLGLNIVKALNETHNVVHFVLSKSNLHDDFLENCELLVDEVSQDFLVKKVFEWLSDYRTPECVISNSVESFNILQEASKFGLPTISLVHEFADYTRPLGKMSRTVFYADKLITPAKIITDSIFRELKSVYGITNEPNNIEIIPQGKLPFMPVRHGKNDSIDALRQKIKWNDSETKVVVGAGFVQIRKGVDLFIAMAKQLQERYDGKCKFIWVGGGYEPTKDLEYSVWLKRQLESSKLGDDFIFLEHQKNLENVLEIADVFCLTSRLDPFPNVIVDALQSDVHIACFAESTGCADFLVDNQADCTVVDYLDTSKLADGIIQYFKSKKKPDGTNRKLVATKLDFKNYMDALYRVMGDAIDMNSHNQAQVDLLIENKVFDADFFDPDMSEREACLFYVNNSSKGIHLYNPRPGFSELDWLNKHEENAYCVPLIEALDSNLLHTHQCQITNVQEVSKKPVFKYAVHIHLYYSDLAEEFASYIKNLPGEFDLYVTYVDEGEASKIEKSLQHCGAQIIKLLLVDNIGRDVVPLVTDLKHDLLKGTYEVIGHFHSKKSLDTNADMGDQWRKYLLDNLMGSKSIASKVLDLFHDKKVGLVFAEDRHCVDFGENREYAEKLCDAMNIAECKNTWTFPLGTMFWARIDALKPLFELDFKPFTQEEPIPYDGSYLHAVERLLPHVCNETGFDFVTVWNQQSSW